MRLLILSGIVALFMLLPALADLRQFKLPYRDFIGIPAVLLEYLIVIIHEMGHTITRWSFGYLAWPSFNFAEGGGMKTDFKHVMTLTWIIYGVSVVGIFLVLLKRKYQLAGALCAVLFVHLFMMFGPGHKGLIFFMGHGLELIVAAYLIVHAARGEAVGGYIAQYFSMIMGLYLMGKNVILSMGLGVGSAKMRAAYAAQKGVHVAGDFRQIAEQIGESVQSVAFYSLAVTVVTAGLVIFLAVYLPAHERLGDIK